MDLYREGLRPILFSGLNLEPEWAHHHTLDLLSWVDQQKLTRPFRSLTQQFSQTFCLRDPRLEQTLWGIPFNNPVGLAAGFDKNGQVAGLWGNLGFGFAELGTVTCHPQPGNPRPRLFRLLKDEAVLNRMGFKNQGSAALSDRLMQVKQQRMAATETDQTWHIPLGINLGKSKVTPQEEAAEDYYISFQRLKSLGDYFVVNVSSPNTPGLRSLQDKDQLSHILDRLQQENTQEKPLLVKIAPDLTNEAILEIITVAQTYRLAGIIATNTTIRREGLQTQVIDRTGKLVTEEAGGISGKPLTSRSTEVIRLIYRQTQGELPIIGVGGIFTAADAWEKITAGASLVQTYTGWIYEGPWIVMRILGDLLERLAEKGLSSISAAVGLEHGDRERMDSEHNGTR
ncbi:MAG: quinone-dependent dihydroorotate dehydrogenase [Microcoleaceae cyanobacterium]